MLKYLFVLLFLVSGCAHSNLWHGDVSFTLVERKAIEEGNEYIAARMGTKPYDIVWDEPHRVDETRCVEDRTIIRRVMREYSGFYRGNPKCVEIDPTDPLMSAVAAHEFGHSRGLGHLPENVPGLMNPVVSAPLPLWSPEDQLMCELTWRCLTK